MFKLSQERRCFQPADGSGGLPRPEPKVQPQGFWRRAIDDIDGMMARDPAATSRLEVALAYQGFHALLLYRFAHVLWRRGWRIPARLVSSTGRFLTGIEIHPGATIGRRLFIDHGSGVVIGETAEIGDDVTLYQDVTLGGVAPSVDSARQRHQKRHPTLADHVIVGSGAQVLGAIVVGEGARVGANAVVVSDVPPHATVVGIPARQTGARTGPCVEDERFVAYGLDPDCTLPDPVARSFATLIDEIERLKRRVADLEATGRATGAALERRPVDSN